MKKGEKRDLCQRATDPIGRSFGEKRFGMKDIMKITLICVGKIKEDFYRKAVAEYEKRLKSYCKLEIIEVADEKAPENISPAGAEQVKEREGARILRHLKADAFVFALEIKGKSPDSIAFANQLDRLAVQGKSHIMFIIGGSLGLHEDVIKAADEGVSFSNMTFPHQLMRVILLEQIYRSYRIIKGEPYHK